MPRLCGEPELPASVASPRPLPAPFCVLATQNPLEMEGTFPLPEAQLDRFMYKVLVPYPTLPELTEIVARTTGTQTHEASAVVSGEQVLSLRETLKEVPAIPPVVEFALRRKMHIQEFARY